MNEELWPLPLPRDGNHPSWVNLAGITHPDPTYHITRQDNPGTVIDYVVSGRGTIIADGIEHRVGPGDIYILPQYHRFEYWSDPQDPMNKYLFNVLGDLIPLLLFHYGLDGYVVVPGVKALPLFKQGIRLVAEEKLTGTHLQQELGVLLHRIIVAAARTIPDADAELPEDVRAIKRYLGARVGEKVTMDELCALVRKSRVQVIRSFKKAMGQPPYDYFLSLKAEQAKLLLRNSNRPVKDIGYGLAFGDEYHFSAFFKKRTGMSPSAYRKLQ